MLDLAPTNSNIKRALRSFIDQCKALLFYMLSQSIETLAFALSGRFSSLA